LDLLIRGLDARPPGREPVEVVERKGTGHPDTICDALADEISLAFCRYYLRRFGAILHHNVDKVLLCGGSARPAFGGGDVLEPIELYLAGRATRTYDGEVVPLEDLAVEACRQWLAIHLPALDVDRHVRIIPRFRPASDALADLFRRHEAAAPRCNDTSCGVGFAPFTPVERAVLEIERQLNGPSMKTAHPAVGRDIKVMGVRRNDRIHFTIACAMIGRHLNGIAEYVEATDDVRRCAQETAQRVTSLPGDSVVNAADDVARGAVYLTVTGTSAEAGDDGEAGRGNRTSGLITPYRPMTIEAAAGKNPVNHVGKLYNLAAGRIADRIAGVVPGVLGATCVLVSQIGRPIDDPLIVDLQCLLERGQRIETVRQPVRDVVDEELSRLTHPRTALLQERVY
jgi:S-adenosylmethionine synthetase